MLDTSLGVATLTGQNFGITEGPDAANDSADTAYGISLNGTVAGNDLYPNGSVFTKTVGPAHGTTSFNPDGSYSYAPSSGFSGSDNFTYQVCLPSPNQSLCDSATVTIDVGKENQLISFGAIPKLFVGGTATVSAIGGGSVNPVIFSSKTTDVCTAGQTNGRFITGIKVGECIIVANQMGDDHYYPAAEVPQSILVTPGFVLTINNEGKLGGTVSSSDGVISCGESCAQSFPDGAAINLKATPKDGFMFKGWGGACSGSGNACTVTLGAAKTVNADFMAFKHRKSSWKRLMPYMQ